MTKEELRNKFFMDCTDMNDGTPKVDMSPHNVFEWINRNIIEQKLIDQSQEPKQREVSEAVEFVDWINNNEINGQYYRHQRLNIWNGDWNPDERHYSQLTTQQLYDLFKSKNK